MPRGGRGWARSRSCPGGTRSVLSLCHSRKDGHGAFLPSGEGDKGTPFPPSPTLRGGLWRPLKAGVRWKGLRGARGRAQRDPSKVLRPAPTSSPCVGLCESCSASRRLERTQANIGPHLQGVPGPRAPRPAPQITSSGLWATLLLRISVSVCVCVWAFRTPECLYLFSVFPLCVFIFVFK